MLTSFRGGRNLHLASLDFKDKSLEDLIELFKKYLNNGLHGLCFSPYVEGQSPGDQLTEEQIRRRLSIIKPHTKWVRSFSTTEGNELIPVIAKEMGMQTLVGAWLGRDSEVNENEMANLIKLANDGYVDIAAVGNEVLYRNDLAESELISHINRVKSEVNVPVGYVDAYYEFQDRPSVTEVCDVILANCYPYWEGCPQDHALLYMKEMFSIAKRAGEGKRVIITETGWPDKGSSLGGSHPSTENALKYFINAQDWSSSEGIEMFYFSSFDESWKVGSEGDVGAFWGIWDKDENLKY